MNEEKNEKWSKFLKAAKKDAIYYSVVFLISAVYVATAIIKLQPTGNGIAAIIADGFFCFLVGFTLAGAFEQQGIKEGERNQRVADNIKSHDEMLTKVAPKINMLDKWCLEENIKALKIKRTRILAECGLRYSDYFDEDGMIKEGASKKIYDRDLYHDRRTRKYEKKKIGCYYAAVNARITRLTASTLTSEGGRTSDPFYFGRSKKEYLKEASEKELTSKIVVSVVFGLFAPVMIGNFSWEILVYKLFQVSLFIAMGMLKKNKAYQYMTDEYCARIGKKVQFLRNFCEEMQIIEKKESAQLEAPKKAEILENKEANNGKEETAERA